MLLEFDNEATPESYIPAAQQAKVKVEMPKRVLIADASGDRRRFLSFVLNKLKIEVTEAAGGMQAVELAMEAFEAGKSYDVVLIDADLPDLSTTEAVRHLRSEGYSSSILAMASYAKPGERDSCQRAGCDDCVIKPITYPSLVRMLAKCASDPTPVFLPNGYDSARPALGQRV